MKKTDGIDAGIGGKALSPALREMVLLLGRVVSNATLYGMNHRVTSEMVDDAFSAVQRALVGVPRISLAMKDGVLMVNGCVADGPQAVLDQLCNRFTAKQVTAFSIKRGMSQAELVNLIEVISSSADQVFEEAMQAKSLGHIATARISYKEVKDSEVVVDRRKVGSGAAKDMNKLAEEWLASQAKARSAETLGMQGGGGAGTAGGGDGGVKEILAFIKGDVSALSEDASQQLGDVADDMDKLASLITEAAAIRQRSNSIADGESMADLVLGCLRRAYGGLRDAAKSTSGPMRVDVKRSLLLLEQNVMNRLRKIMDNQDASGDAAIAEALRGVTEDAEADLLVDEYLEKYEAAKQNEKELVEFASHHGGERVRQKLQDAGVTDYQWQKLVSRKRRQELHAEGMGSGGGGMETDVGALALILGRMDKFMSDSSPDNGQVGELVKEVCDSLEPVTVGTDARLEALQGHIKTLEGSNGEGGSAARAKRNLVYATLAEIAQELLQPLTVISCSLNMLLSGYGGELGGEQSDVLHMANEGADRMEYLISKLTKIVGMPAQLFANKQLLDLDLGLDTLEEI